MFDTRAIYVSLEENDDDDARSTRESSLVFTTRRG